MNATANTNTANFDLDQFIEFMSEDSNGHCFFDPFAKDHAPFDSENMEMMIQISLETYMQNDDGEALTDFAEQAVDWLQLFIDNADFKKQAIAAMIAITEKSVKDYKTFINADINE